MMISWKWHLTKSLPFHKDIVETVLENLNTRKKGNPGI